MILPCTCIARPHHLAEQKPPPTLRIAIYCLFMSELMGEYRTAAHKRGFWCCFWYHETVSARLRRRVAWWAAGRALDVPAFGHLLTHGASSGGADTACFTSSHRYCLIAAPRVWAMTREVRLTDATTAAVLWELVQRTRPRKEDVNCLDIHPRGAQTKMT